VHDRVRRVLKSYPICLSAAYFYGARLGNLLADSEGFDLIDAGDPVDKSSSSSSSSMVTL
jgi:hypothetical protein